MIHKRFNYTRHLVWAGFFLAIFLGTSVTHKQNTTVETLNSVTAFTRNSAVPEKAILLSTLP